MRPDPCRLRALERGAGDAGWRTQIIWFWSSLTRLRLFFQSVGRARNRPCGIFVPGCASVGCVLG